MRLSALARNADDFWRLSGIWAGEGRLVTLLEMVKFRAKYFYTLSLTLDRLALLHHSVAKKRPDEKLSAEQRADWIRTLKVCEKNLSKAQLRYSIKPLRKLISGLEHSANIKTVALGFGELRRAIEYEIEDLSVWQVPRDKTAYLDKDLFGLEKRRRFRDAHKDIIEAGRCLAFNRNTASVFHLMRVMECGLRALAASLNDPNLDPRTNPTWETILKRGDGELKKPLKDRSKEWSSHDSFFSAAQANLRAVKDAWRNPTVHVERSYDDEESTDVFNAVRGFMRHLAQRLGV